MDHNLRNAVRIWHPTFSGIRVSAIAIAAALLLVLGAACSDDEEPETVALTLQEIVTEPDEHVGAQVTVTGRVTEIVDDYTFLVGEDEVGDQTILVASLREISDPVEVGDPLVAAGDEVEVSGTVAILTAEDEDAFEDRDFLFEESTLERFQNQPVVLADQIVRSNGE